MGLLYLFLKKILYLALLKHTHTHTHTHTDKKKADLFSQRVPLLFKNLAVFFRNYNLLHRVDFAMPDFV